MEGRASRQSLLRSGTLVTPPGSTAVRNRHISCSSPLEFRVRLGLRLAITIGVLVAPALAVAQPSAMRPELVAAIDDEMLLKTLANLAADSMQGRKIASPGSLKAREYIVRELGRIGVEPLVPGFVAEFPGSIPHMVPVPERRGATSILGQPSQTTVRTMRSATGSNILGVVRGTERPDRYIVLSAHYDHLGLLEGQLLTGANDNASGVAAVLTIAELLVAAKPKNSIILAFFDGEEFGMLGSYAFVRKPPVPIRQISANVNLDMIARSKDDVLYFVGERYQPRLAALATVVGESGIVRITPGHDGRDSREDFFRRSDQWPFHQRDIPAVLFTATEIEDYHTRFDVTARVNIGFYIRAVSGIADYLRRLDDDLEKLTGKPR
jgi:hypothetical protein